MVSKLLLFNLFISLYLETAEIKESLCSDWIWKNQIWNDQRRNIFFPHRNCPKDWLRYRHSENCFITPVSQAGPAFYSPKSIRKLPLYNTTKRAQLIPQVEPEINWTLTIHSFHKYTTLLREFFPQNPNPTPISYLCTATSASAIAKCKN